MPTKYEGLAAAIFHEQADPECSKFSRETTEITSFMKKQHTEYVVEQIKIKRTKQEVINEKESTYNNKTDHQGSNHFLI